MAKKVAKSKKVSSKSKKLSKDDQIAELTSLVASLIKKQSADTKPAKRTGRRSAPTLAAAVSSRGVITVIVNENGLQAGLIRPDADQDARLEFGPENLATGVSFGQLRELMPVQYDGNPPQNIRPA